MNLFTIGYATKDIELFVEQLKKHGITALADVRSVPYSGTFKEYNQDRLAECLKINGIAYVHLGDELGPRSRNPDHYDENGQVQFHLLRKSKLFRSGMTRIEQGLKKGHKIAMMCAEKDPAVCHRSLLVSESAFEDLQQSAQHILYDGALEDHNDLRHRIMEQQGMAADMFSPIPEMLEAAMKQQVKRCAYTKPQVHAPTP